MPRAPVGEEVEAAEGRDRRAAVHVAAGHRVAEAAAVLAHRERQRALREPCGRSRVVDQGALVAVPAEVGARRPARPQVVDLLAGALAHVADPERPGGAVEREAPRVAEPLGVDGHAHRRDVDVEPQELAEAAPAVLCASLRVAGAAAVAHAHVEPSVRPELQLAAVVIGVRLVDSQDDPGARGDGRVRVGRRRPIAHHARVAGGVRVVHVEPPVRRVARVERHREQPLLAAPRDLAGDVEERLREHGAVLDDADRARLLDDEEARGVATRRREVHGLVERAGELLERDGRRRRRRARSGGRRGKARSGRGRRGRSRRRRRLGGAGARGRRRPERDQRREDREYGGDTQDDEQSLHEWVDSARRRTRNPER